MRGAYFFTEEIVSILSPPDALRPVVTKEMPSVTVYSTEFLVYVNLPEKEKLLTPFALSPLLTI